MSKETDCKFAALQLEFEKKCVDIQLLEAKLSELEFEKVKVEDQCQLLRKRNEELEEEIKKIGNDKIVGSNVEKGKTHMVDLFGDEEDEVLQLMIEIKVLECEKRKAESEVEEWKAKFVKLQSRMDELENSFALEGQKSASSAMREIDQRLNETRETDEKGNGIQGALSSANLQVENLERKEDGCASVGAGNCYSLMDKKDVEEAGTPLARTPLQESTYDDRRKQSTPLKYEIQDKFRVRKRLAFPQDESPTKKMAPSTPAWVRPADVDVIDIDDSDDEKKTTLDHSAPPTVLIGKSVQQSTHFGQDVLNEESKLSCRCRMISTGQCSNDCCEENLSFQPTFRRKFWCNVVTSDAESDDDDDDVPLSRLINNRNKEKEPLDHMGKYGRGSFDSGDEVGESAESPCLRRLRKGKERRYPEKDSPSRKNCAGRNCSTGIPTTAIVTDNNDEDGDSCHSEGDSLDGFIVNSSNLSDSEETSDSVEATLRDNSSSSENSHHSDDVSNGKLDYRGIISRIQRSGNHKAKWEFEADMLADFGKNPELCMRAVCALYRQQTSAERIAKGTFVCNGRGFNQCDAFRGSRLAEFLTNGQSDLHKSVDELIEYDPKGPEKCRELACRYSKQLFEIYVNQEDPYFLPSQGQP